MPPLSKQYVNLIYSNFDPKFALCSKYYAVLCYDYRILSTEIVIINKINFLLHCHFGDSYIEIFTESFLELSSYILGSSREIPP